MIPPTASSFPYAGSVSFWRRARARFCVQASAFFSPKMRGHGDWIASTSPGMGNITAVPQTCLASAGRVEKRNRLNMSILAKF
jgi:hypothetical protein